ncbi:CHAT domain-containing protein [Streptomyces flavochromogenes]|uniref:CHAT domain-containing protein n=1 Tax=Streptomyces flavochromogenes TaxID=68199 RepID=UPI001FD7BA4F|nr:CHAT domain-containing protein [Streptomyces flavochromogenes]
MRDSVTYGWAPRCEDERLLRALRDSDLWHSDMLEEKARDGWLALLNDPDLDGDEFTEKCEEVYDKYTGAIETWGLFLRQEREGLRGVPVGAVPDGRHVEPVPHDEEASDAVPVTDGSSEPDATERFLNVAVVWPLSRVVIPSDRLLASGRTYELRVDIGGLEPGSLLAAQAEAFPDNSLDHTDDDGSGDWLQVTVVSDDLRLPAAQHWLFLPREGASWVCHCQPGGRHTCEEGHRGRHLHIPFVAPEEPGPARLRMFVSYRGNQLQSVTLTTSIAADEGPGGATTAAVDYTLTSGFAALSELPRRSAAVRVGRQDGAMTIDVTAGGGPLATFWLSEHQVVTALEQARAALFACHAEFRVEGGASRPVNLLDANHGKDFPALLRDMTRLARLGWTLYQMVARSRPEREALRHVLREPAEIQVCRTELNDLVFPWALLYDNAVESDAALEPCAAGWERVRQDPTARSCPEGAVHPLNTLCPYGFWGFRHIIEQPPSVRRGRRIRLRAGREGTRPSLTVARSHALAGDVATRHLSVLRGSFAELRVCDRKQALRQSLTDTPGDCLYFYGHGRRPQAGEVSTPTVLEIGGTDRILPEDLNAWGEDPGWDGWERVAPLVFLNGCHTADHDARSWLPFVTAFAGLQAAGVVGTEITVEQGLAGRFAERFWELLLAGHDVGSALHQVRMELLGQGNVLGLAYTAYCSAALRLSFAS